LIFYTGARVTSYSDTLQRGDTISCYQIEEVLGRGGFAVTYLAVDLNLDVYVAIKEYLPREIIHRDQQLNVAARKPEFIEDYNIGLSNFAREAKTLARFKHLNIVRVHQVIHKHNTAYMVMDYEHGREFADVLAERQTLPEDELREILFPIFDGVEEIHRHGLAHRDIKPSNIYLRDNGSPVLLDFGAARFTMSESTQQLTAVVTVGYTPIEQYNVSENEQGPWSDIYALAAVLYEAVTGEMPVDSVTRASSRVTNSTDPLAPVANKARQDYSDYFLNAIDWGLNMEAEDRPHSIAQWRDAFNGVFKPVETYEQAQKKPARKSKLKTRADELPVAPVAPTPPADDRFEGNRGVEGLYNDRRPQYETANISHEPHLSVDLRDNHSGGLDHLESVPLNPDAPAPSVHAERHTGTTGAAATYRDSTTTVPPPPMPSSPFASNPVARRESAGEPAFDDTLNNLIDAEGRPTHTQELRKVLRRDIVRREAPPPRPAPDELPRQTAYADQFEPPREDRYDAPPSHNRAYRDETRVIRPPRGNVEDDFDFDDTDWDYEPPAGPSKWKWILPVLGLAAVAGTSLLFVNKPELFRLPSQSGPELTVETALQRANEKISDRELIFPEGTSALDYFQLILESEPDNAEALGGVASIRDEIKRQIVTQVDNDNLAEANRLLSRANAANLEIDGVLSGNSSVSDDGERAVAIDRTASPWVNQRIENIEELIAAGDFESAEVMLEDTDKYIADAALSDSLKQRIENGKLGIEPAAQETTATESTGSDAITTEDTAVVTPINNAPIVAESEDTSALITTPIASPEITQAAPVIQSTDTFTSTTDTDAIAVEPDSPSVADELPAENIPVVEQKIAVESEPDRLPSAPRRSFIEGNDETAQHLNQLRLALEDKNLQRVLQVSDALPEERTDFLRRLFQRYDRIDVTIDNINRSGTTATAKLSVAMFNQRSDGSFYSAGKWSDVELSTDRRNGQWQQIQW
jgi:serine/threonine protein kinase